MYFDTILWKITDYFLLRYFFLPNLSFLLGDPNCMYDNLFYVVPQITKALFFCLFPFLTSCFILDSFLSFFKLSHLLAFEICYCSSSDLFFSRQYISILEFSFGSLIVCICLLGFAICSLIMSIFYLNYGIYLQ